MAIPLPPYKLMVRRFQNLGMNGTRGISLLLIEIPKLLVVLSVDYLAMSFIKLWISHVLKRCEIILKSPKRRLMKLRIAK